MEILCSQGPPDPFCELILIITPVTCEGICLFIMRLRGRKKLFCLLAHLFLMMATDGGAPARLCSSPLPSEAAFYLLFCKTSYYPFLLLLVYNVTVLNKIVGSIFFSVLIFHCYVLFRQMVPLHIEILHKTQNST